MIIRSGETITIQAVVSPRAGLNGGTITWEPATPDPRAETVARAMNSHAALLEACREAHHELRIKCGYKPGDHCYDTLAAAIARAEGGTR